VKHRWVLAVQIFQSADKLLGPGNNLFFGDKFLPVLGVFNDFAEVLAGHKVHHQVFAAVKKEEVGNFR